MSLNVLKAVWGSQEGYVFIPTRKGKSWKEGKAYQYPTEWLDVKSKIEKAIEEGEDTYWCPLVFDKPKRVKEAVKPQQAILWADLDFVDPTKLETLRPSIAWASSDKRYQALWALDGFKDIHEVEEINKELTYYIGADKGGWDVTQVLRVPGSPNHKYDPIQKGRMLWAEKRIFAIEDVKKTIEYKAVKDDITDRFEDLLEGWDIPKRAMDLLNATEAEIVGEDRSERLWEIETLLVEAGLPILNIVNIISKSVWNKFKGRKGELDQIYKEVMKADAHVKTKVKEKSLTLSLTDPDSVALKEQAWAIPFNKFMIKDIEKPEWLVEGIWQKGTYGMIAGEPKTYKSVQATDLALSVASGKPFLNHFPVKTRGNVLYVQEENGEQTVQDRVFKIAASKGLLTSTKEGWALPKDLPLHFSNNYGINLTEKDSRTLLEQTIQQINPVLLILDPLYMMFGSVDENSAKEVGDVLRWLTYIRNQYKCAILICHHYNKGSGNSRGGQRVRGSSAFHAWVESALYIKTTSMQYTVEIEREFRAYPTMGDIEVKIELGLPGVLYYNPTVRVDSSVKALKVSDKILEEEILARITIEDRAVGDLSKAYGVSNIEIKNILKPYEEKGIIALVNRKYRLIGKVSEIEADIDYEEEL